MRSMCSVRHLLLAGLILWIILFLYFSLRLTATYPHTSSQVVQYHTKTVQQSTIYKKVKLSEALRKSMDMPIYKTAHGNKTTHARFGHCHWGGKSVINTSHAYGLDILKGNVSRQEPLLYWMSNSFVSLCNATMNIYADTFALIKNVVINPEKRQEWPDLAKGGEHIFEVPLQSIDREVYILQNGFYEIYCDRKDIEEVLSQNESEILQVVDIRYSDSDRSNYISVHNYTIAIARSDYANLWNHMCEFYGTFLMMLAFDLKPEHVNIVFLDGHPKCPLDRNWEYIFGQPIHIGQIESRMSFDHLILGLPYKRIPLSRWRNEHCPYIEEFRTFILSQYDISVLNKRLNCERLTVTFILRRDKVYHPRNMEGKVQRKIFNENDVLEILIGRLQGVCVQAFLLESLPMETQLEIISETDLLIGMHGAGLTHLLFLPKHAAVLELFPYHWKRERKWAIMFEKLAKWRGLIYGSWENTEPEIEIRDQWTFVNTEEIFDAIIQVLKRMCPNDYSN